MSSQSTPAQVDTRGRGRGNIAFGVVFPRTGTVFEQLAVEDRADLLRDALVPGTHVERYNRVWRFARWEEEDGWALGRIGFEREAGVTELWDDDELDFTPQQMVAGETSPFALDLESGLVSFQLRSGQIRPTSFTGALKALLNEAQDVVAWDIDYLVLGMSWKRFTQQVVAITRLELRVEPPNPNYAGRERLEELIEGSRSQMMKIIAEADPGDLEGLDVTETLLSQAIDHAEQGYGTRTARGLTIDEDDRQYRQVDWREDQEGVPIRDHATPDEETKEISPSVLRRKAAEAWNRIPFFADRATELGAHPPAAGEDAVDNNQAPSDESHTSDVSSEDPSDENR